MKQGVFVFLFVTGIVVLLFIGEAYLPQVNPYSSSNRGPQGSLAFYLLLQEYTEVERITAPFENLGPGTLIMVAPLRVATPEEKWYIYEWVEEGNRLIVFSDSPQIMQSFGGGLSQVEDSLVFLTPEKDHWSTEHVKSIYVMYSQYFAFHQGDVLFADRGKPIVVEIKRGEGEIFLVTTTSLVWNVNIAEADNEIFLVQLSLADKVYFDEYHSYTRKEERGIHWKDLKSVFSGHSTFFIQLTVAVALLLIGYGKRFGVPRPLLPREVQSSELVVSAADLYYKARRKEVLAMVGEKREKIR